MAPQRRIKRIRWSDRYLVPDYQAAMLHGRPDVRRYQAQRNYLRRRSIMHMTMAIQRIANMSIFLSSNTKLDAGGKCTMKEGTPYKQGSISTSSRSRLMRWFESEVRLACDNGMSTLASIRPWEDISELHSSAYTMMMGRMRSV